jgi:hypothetical protein
VTIGLEMERQRRLLEDTLAAVQDRRRFFEDELLADLQARMDRWPVELLADQIAYEAFRNQLFSDLREMAAEPDGEPGE